MHVVRAHVPRRGDHGGEVSRMAEKGAHEGQRGPGGEPPCAPDAGSSSAIPSRPRPSWRPTCPSACLRKAARTCRPKARSRPSTWCTARPAAGARVMTSLLLARASRLKGEGISYMAGADLPGVIINVQRGGPGLGGIQPSQSDYWQATRGARPRRLPDHRLRPVHRAGDGRSDVYEAFDMADQLPHARHDPGRRHAGPDDGAGGAARAEARSCRTSPGPHAGTRTSARTTSSTRCT